MEERIYRKLRPLLDAMPGLISLKYYVADDGEELGVIRFDSRESLDKWMHESAHADAQKLDPDVYERYWIQTAERYREYIWENGKRTDGDIRHLFAEL